MPDAPKQQEPEFPASPDRKTSLLKRLATPAAAGFWILLYVSTHVPNPDAIVDTHLGDKVLHFSAYFALFVVLAVRIRIIHESWPNRRQTVNLWIITSLYAAFDEITQGIPIINRYPDVMDAVADCSGVIAAIVLVQIIGWCEGKLRAA